MEMAILVGLALAVCSGTLDGSMAYPMQFARRWRWENIWIVFSIFGMILLPSFVVFLTLGNVFTVYERAPGHALWAAFGFGAGWGVGNTLFGAGITLLGMGLGNALIISLSSVMGALIPLITLHPEKLGTFEGNVILLSLGVLVVGISLCSLAARRRKDEKPMLIRERTNFFLGFLACIASGIFSPMLNLAFAFGAPISQAALSLGASKIGASIALLNLALLAGFIPNAIYCAYLLNRNRTWKDFTLPNTASHWSYGFMMGLAMMGAFLVYGVANLFMGPMGPVLGWPVYMATLILTANIWGLIRGEWQGSDRKTYIYLFCGIAIIVVSIYLVSLSQ